MKRERVLKIVLATVGLLFVAAVYPLVIMRREPALQMMLSVYLTLGVFLLLAVRNPLANRSLIAFAAWSSLIHAATMAVQVYFKMIAKGELIGVAVFALVGAVLLMILPTGASTVSARLPKLGETHSPVA
jgi:hypothetical protein